MRVTGKITWPNSTGIMTIASLPMTPAWLKSVTSGKDAGSNSTARIAEGEFDGTNQWAVGSLVGIVTGSEPNHTDICVLLLSTPGGVFTAIGKAIGVDFPANSARINVTATDNQYPMFLTFGDS